jgi:hypothetical protein
MKDMKTMKVKPSRLKKRKATTAANVSLGQLPLLLATKSQSMHEETFWSI